MIAFRPTLAALLLAALATLAAPSSAHADAFDDFRIPDNSALLWTGNASSSADWNSSNTEKSRDKSGDASGHLNTNLWWLSDSDLRSTTLNFSLIFDGNRSAADGETWDTDPSQVESESTHDRYLGQFASVSLSNRTYAHETPWYVVDALGASGSYRQSWGDSRRRTELSIGTDS